MISVYSDGSSGAGGGKPGGYGWLVVRDRKDILAWAYGGSASTTNNLMEMEGAIQGLAALVELGLHQSGEVTELVSDSMYVLNMAQGTWAVNANHEQVARLQEVYQLAGSPRTRWVRGHQGETHNEYCDQLAKQGKIENTDPAKLAAKKKRS